MVIFYCFMNEGNCVTLRSKDYYKIVECKILILRERMMIMPERRVKKLDLFSQLYFEFFLSPNFHILRVVKRHIEVNDPFNVA
jgi:hypothetical protein